MSVSTIQQVRVIDSHTGGEPTRIVLSGGPDLGGGSVAEQLEIFRRDHDRFRAAIVNEPRGSDVIVGALLVKPSDESCVAGVIFFNNVGCLWMCGHGTIGLVITLAHLGRIGPGNHRFETAVGTVTATLHPNGEASVTNVESYRHRKSVRLNVPGIGDVTGDIAWGGNWFFLIENHNQRIELSNVERLTDYTRNVRQALNSEGITGATTGEIDHIELFGAPSNPGAHSKNFVLCPGNAYDRSPCGTGTSAKLACLAADGKLAPGESWRQESIIGSIFTGRYRRQGERIIPTITGSAFVTSESTFLLNPADAFCWGIQ